MNTQLNIKTRQLQFSPTFATLLIGIVMVLVLGGSSVQAQTATTATTDTTATTAAPAPAVVESSITMAVKGSVNDPSGPITVNGTITVTAKRVLDTTTTTSAAAAPVVVLDFDFSQLKGTSGSLDAQRVYITGDNHSTEIRPLQASDTIMVTTPYFDDTKGPLTARTWLVTSTLNFDVNSGKLTSGSSSVGDNVVTKTAVGSVATSSTSSTSTTSTTPQ